MNGLAGATIKDYLTVAISGHGIPTVAFSARVQAGGIAVRRLGAGQTASDANIPVVALLATTETRASIAPSFEIDSVVKHCLTTGHGGNCQGMLDGSICPASGLANPQLVNSAGGCSR